MEYLVLIPAALLVYWTGRFILYVREEISLKWHVWCWNQQAQRWPPTLKRNVWSSEANARDRPRGLPPVGQALREYHLGQREIQHEKALLDFKKRIRKSVFLTKDPPEFLH